LSHGFLVSGFSIRHQPELGVFQQPGGVLNHKASRCD
jgi:hypothetical protein